MEFYSLSLSALAELELFALFQFHEGLFPIGPFSGKSSQALDLALHIQHIDALDVDFQERFDGLFDLNPIRIRMYQETDGIAAFAQCGNLFRQQGLDENTVEVDFHAQTSFTLAKSRSGITIAPAR